MKIDNSQQVLDFVDSHASQKFISENCLYLTRSGSKSYNTHIESSDDDIKGVTLAPKNYHYGFLNNFEQYEHKDPDIVIYGLQKYTQLAVNNNPNMLETLYTDVSDILYMHPAFEKLMSIRDEALSKRAYHTFTGYARGQMQRLNNHKHWIDNPLVEPKIEDYGIVDNKKYKALYQLVASEIKLEIDKSYFNDFQNQMEMTHAFYSVLTEWKLAKDKIWESHLERFVGTGDVYSQIVKYKNYDKDLKNYKKYMTWKNERNAKRAEQEIKIGYDCYSSDTEFLTDSGWKLFDDITIEDNLATFFARRNCDESDLMTHRPFLGIEYQKYVDKFDSLYNGPMYQVTAQCTDILVTSNHKMFFQKLERDSDKIGNWQFDDANNLPDTFSMLIAPTPRKTSYSNKEFFKDLEITGDDYISLMGWFLSDGCLLMQESDSTKVKYVRISQKPDGRLSRKMKSFHKKYQNLGGVNLYIYDREPNEFNPQPHQEMILDISLKNVREKIFEDCGRTVDKKIPRYVFGLSHRLIFKLLVGLIEGDGTQIEHKTKTDSYVYYTNSKKLADEVQELAFMAGCQTSLNGPYEDIKQINGREYTSIMYQVHIRVLSESDRSKKMIRSKNITKVHVSNHRVVCFSVPNGTLVTRRNGRIGMQGNCKFAYHIIRLLTMSKEILSDHKVVVKRVDDRDLYIDIRNGKYSFDEFKALTDDLIKQNDEAFKGCTLPDLPNFKKFDDAVVAITEELC